MANTKCNLTPCESQDGILKGNAVPSSKSVSLILEGEVFFFPIFFLLDQWNSWVCNFQGPKLKTYLTIYNSKKKKLKDGEGSKNIVNS